MEMKCYDGGLRPPRPGVLKDGVVLGANGVILTDWDNGWHMFPEKRATEYGTPPEVLARSPGHHEEWILACEGGPEAGSNFDWAGPLTEGMLLGNVALRSQVRDDLTMKKLL